MNALSNRYIYYSTTLIVKTQQKRIKVKNVVRDGINYFAFDY